MGIRGKIIWLDNSDGDCTYIPEINGSMSPEMSIGKIAIDKFKTCKTTESYVRKATEMFKMFGNKEDYTDEDLEDGLFLHTDNIVRRNFHNVTNEEYHVGQYYLNWNADFLYVLNETGSDIEVKGFDGNPVKIENGYINIFDYGEPYGKIPIIDEIPVNSWGEGDMDNNEKSEKEESGMVREKVPLKEIVEKYAVEITKDDMLLIDSLRDVLDSGVEKLTLAISDRTGRVVIDENCYKGIMCQCVKVAKISDKGQFDSKSEAKLHIETSSWHFPCPDYKYSNIKRNLEKAICVICGIKDVEVKSFSTGIVEFDDADRSIHKE